MKKENWPVTDELPAPKLSTILYKELKNVHPHKTTKRLQKVPVIS